MTPSGIKPATFRFVAQRLSHCATAVPQQIILRIFIYCTVKYNTVNNLFRLLFSTSLQAIIRITDYLELYEKRKSYNNPCINTIKRCHSLLTNLIYIVKNCVELYEETVAYYKQ